jgi:hypothetical protein
MLSNYSIRTIHRHQNLNGFVSNLRLLKSKIKRMSITKITFELFAIIIYLERVGRPMLLCSCSRKHQDCFYTGEAMMDS